MTSPSSSPKKKYPCPVPGCGKKFETLATLSRHGKRAHGKGK